MAMWSEMCFTRIPVSHMFRGFGDLQYMWSMSVAFALDVRVGNVIIGTRIRFIIES